jgi:hypothetical protein
MGKGPKGGRGILITFMFGLKEEREGKGDN